MTQYNTLKIVKNIYQYKIVAPLWAGGGGGGSEQAIFR